MFWLVLQPKDMLNIFVSWIKKSSVNLFFCQHLTTMLCCPALHETDIGLYMSALYFNTELNTDDILMKVHPTN